MKHIFLDSYPLGLLSKPVKSADVIEITDWTKSCLASGHKLYVPEVIDYELRRELLRAEKTEGLDRLDGLQTIFRYLPITTSAMILAAKLWAQMRRGGTPTGDPKKLDVDVILAAQALTVHIEEEDEIVVATVNVSHLSRMVAADLWTDIKP